MKKHRDKIKSIFLLFVASILAFFKVRFVHLWIHRIGHLATECDCHLKAKLLGIMPNTFDIIFPPVEQKFANKFLMECWKSHLFFITSNKLRKILQPLAYHPLLSVNVEHYICALNHTALYFHVQSQYHDGPPILRLKKKDLEQGNAWLRSMGMATNDWYVCMHCREDNFFPGEEQSYRNGNIASFQLAIDAIVNHGGWVIRMGDKTMKPLIQSHHKVVDYCHTPAKSEFLDIFLPSQCRFFLGSCSGLASVPVLFNIPVLSVNMSPLSTVLHYSYRDLAIPKLMWSRREKRMLTFPEVLDSPISNFRFRPLFEQAEIDVIDNTPTEILEAVQEMLDQLDGKQVDPDKKLLQQRFVNLFKPGHHSYGSSARLCSSFLIRHSELLDGYPIYASK